MGIFRRLTTSGGEGSTNYPFKFTILVPTAGVTFTLPIVDYGALTPSIVVDWGDGSGTTAITSSTSASRIHTYSAVGSPTTYTVTIYGFLPGFRVNNNASIRSLVNGIIQFGTVGLRTLNNSVLIGRNHSTYLSGCIPPYVDLRWSEYGGEVTIKSIELSSRVFRTSKQSP